jgi:hypothetical protein
VDAQLALQGSAALSAGGLDVAASFSLVASVGPVSLESELDGERRLVADRCRVAVAALSGVLADDLDEVADLLESVLPSGILADADTFLAALDPEPIAAELDALLTDVLDAVPGFFTVAGDVLVDLAHRVRGLLETLGPGALAQRYLGVLDVVREELAVLDPGRLADELGEVHAEVRAALVAYDPRVLAGELDALRTTVAVAVRELGPANLVPDLSGIAAQVARVETLLPVDTIAAVGRQLDEVGAELRALDLQGMLDAVNAVGPELAEAITFLVNAIRDEIVTLLESIRFASGSVTVTVEVG